MMQCHLNKHDTKNSKKGKKYEEKKVKKIRYIELTGNMTRYYTEQEK